MLFSYIINIIKNILNFKHHGNHVFGDFIWDVNSEKIDDIVLAETIFQIMKDAIKTTKMTVVHEKLCLLGIDNSNTPPGFTSVLLLDESHCSSHCYSDRGWLAIDVFTCGNTNPEKIMDYISREIKNKYPTLVCTYKRNHKRFHHI